jgi:hypothetical protein
VHPPGHDLDEMESRQEHDFKNTEPYGLSTRGMTKMTKTKITLAALLLAGTASTAMAQGEFDPNLANRYATLASSEIGAARAKPRTLRSAPVRLQQIRPFNRGFQAPIDRESRPHAGGVG